MILAQSGWATVGQTIPVAALTTVSLGYWLAHWNSRRSEFGKLQAASEIDLRRICHALRNELEYARAILAARSTYDPKAFSGERIELFAAEAVAAARGLSAGKQKKVRAGLVELVGEWRVRMAEDIGAAILAHANSPVSTSPATVPHLSPADAQRGWYITYVGTDGDVGEALLHELSMAQLPDQVHPRAIAVLDRLLEAVGASAGLNGRR